MNRRALTRAIGAGLVCAGAMLAPCTSSAVDKAGKEPGILGPTSPWIALPIFSSSPKLGTSLGGLGAYLHQFDAASRPSIFGVAAQYTTTDSATAAAFAKASWGADHHRLLALAAAGRIRNDYDDFLGTGRPLKTEDDLAVFLARYLYRLKDDWFIGVQGIYTNYHIVGQSAFDDQVLNVLGLTGFRSGGIGAVAMYDSRDNDYSPTSGWALNFNNIAYRKALGGEEDFDVYRADIRGYWQHGARHVFALRQSNQWTVDAPPAAHAPILLRGYKIGQYLGESMSSIEVEERLRVAERWTATLFMGVACLYGGGRSCTVSDNLYPAVGAGIQFILKPKEGIVANLEYAKGKLDNHGVYLKLGYAF